MSMHSYANFGVCIPLDTIIKHLNLEKDYKKIKEKFEPSDVADFFNSYSNCDDENDEILFQNIINKIEQFFNLEGKTSLLNVDFTDDTDYAGFDGDEGLYLCIDFDAMFQPTQTFKMLKDNQLDPVFRHWVTIG